MKDKKPKDLEKGKLNDEKKKKEDQGALDANDLDKISGGARESVFNKDDDQHNYRG